MTAIIRNSKALVRRPALTRPAIQRMTKAKFMPSNDLRRFIPMDKPIDYNPDYTTFPPLLKWGFIGSVVALIVANIVKAEREPHSKREFKKTWDQPNTVKKYVIIKYKSKVLTPGRPGSFYTKFIDKPQD